MHKVTGAPVLPLRTASTQLASREIICSGEMKRGAPLLPGSSKDVTNFGSSAAKPTTQPVELMSSNFFIVSLRLRSYRGPLLVSQ